MRKLFALASAIVVLVGCTGSDGGDGLTEKDKTAASRIEQIAKASGGDWNKVSDADKKYLVNEVSMGSEQSAKMLILSKAGGFRGSPGGAPKGSGSQAK